MASSFLDTSALAKLYHQEAGTEFVENLLLQPTRFLLISRLCVLEMESVFARKIRTGSFTQEEVGIARQRFGSDLRKRRLHTIAVVPRHFEEAERLIREHGAPHGLRTLDAVQLFGGFGFAP